MAKRNRLSKIEIDAILTAAGAADPTGTFEDMPDKEAERMEAALESGLRKLRAMFWARERRLSGGVKKAMEVFDNGLAKRRADERG